jgi:hypothetical protein
MPTVGARPGIVLTPPERERGGMTSMAELVAQPPSVPFPSVTVYIVSGNRCEFCDELMYYLQNEFIFPHEVHDVLTMGAPEWLQGVPSLLEDDQLYSGDPVYARVEALAEMAKHQQNSSRVTEPNSFGGVATTAPVRKKGGSAGSGGTALASAFRPPAPELDDETLERKYSMTKEKMAHMMAQRR